MPDLGSPGDRWRAALLLIACFVPGFAGFGLPAALHAVGLHPHHERGDFDLEGRRALLIATNRAVLATSGTRPESGSPR